LSDKSLVEDADWTQPSQPTVRRLAGFPVGCPIAAEQKLLLHVGLFFATLVSTFYVGGTMNPGGFNIWTGLGYSISIMAILTAHEVAHYLMAKRHGVAASLPYFVPFPSLPGVIWSPFGTMGAVIVMKSRMPDRRALLDISAAGPIAGFVVTLFVAVVGLSLSTVSPIYGFDGQTGIMLGDPLLLKAMQWLVLGPIPQGEVVVLHPIAYAAWAGLFVTALNLIPFGQLDGGHIVYAFWPHRHRMIAHTATAGLIVLAIQVSPIWTLWAILGVAFGGKHPTPLSIYIPLDRRRRLVAYACGAILLLTFMHNPIDVSAPSLAP
jgi:membrane-associated protease RseP (regulator of RpoE activity)